ncbi:Putative F-box protein [Arachis hypogaea]|nr:Putative F-box protein [Arachis hypogaea]
MNDVLPLDLIRRIFLRLPAKELFRLKCVSKLWRTLISDRDFAESHLSHYSVAPSHSCLFVNYFFSVGHIVDLDTLAFKELSLPFSRKKRSFDFRVMGSCRAFHSPNPWVTECGNLLGKEFLKDIYTKTTGKTYIWVMKEYKVASSWILVYDIPYAKSMPLCLSNGNDVIALLSTFPKLRFAKYNVSGELLQQINDPIPLWYRPTRNRRLTSSVYTESLLPFPDDTKD